MSDFCSNKRFFDDENFPYGFERSGEFTSAQAKLLTDHGLAYKALLLKAKEPVSEEEKRFVMFCDGFRDAETVHEKTWKKYMDACGRVMEYHSVTANRSALAGYTEIEGVDVNLG